MVEWEKAQLSASITQSINISNIGCKNDYNLSSTPMTHPSLSQNTKTVPPPLSLVVHDAQHPIISVNYSLVLV